jgi:hypothetical protein
MQNVGVAHDTVFTPLVPNPSTWLAALGSMTVGPDHVDPRKTKAVPLTPTATQKVGPEHETLVRLVSWRVRGCDHVPSSDWIASPWSSTTMQKCAVEHDTLTGVLLPALLADAWAGRIAR